jgi:hypothetical protein
MLMPIVQPHERPRSKLRGITSTRGLNVLEASFEDCLARDSIKEDHP